MRLKNNPFVRKIDKIVGIIILWFISLFRKKQSNIPNNVKRILVIRLAAIGDTVLLIPALRAIKERYPNAELDMLASDVNFAIIKYCPFISKKFMLNFMDNSINLIENIELIRSIRTTRYDIVIDFEPYVRITAILSHFFYKKYLIGFRTYNEKKHIAFDDFVMHSDKVHEIENLLAIPKKLGCQVENKKLELYLSETTKDNVDNLFSKYNIIESKIIVVHPATGVPNHPRQWPVEYFVEVISFLLKSDDIKIILIGAKLEKPIADTLEKVDEKRIVNFCGITNLYETIEIIKRASFFISGNTGTMHIASVFDIPFIALHGPTNPVRFGPLSEKGIVIKSNMDCAPCLHLGFEYSCNEYKCMSLIKPDEVINSIKKYYLFTVYYRRD